MKFSTVLAFAGAAVAQSSFGNVTWTTTTVQSIVTYCPEPTVITHGSKTYTVTKATTLTITDCPCTVKVPVTTKVPETVCKTCNATVPTPGKPSPPPVTVVPTGGLPPKPSGPVQAGAAKLSGAGLAVVLGAAILL